MDSIAPLWDIYFTYIDNSIVFHYLFDDSGKTHHYPLVEALLNGWISVDGHDKPEVRVERLPAEARRVWDAFFNEFGSSNTRIRPRGEAKNLEQQFQKLTGT